MNIVIIGNGISGTTAARHIRKLSNHNITIISSETPHFFSRTALMYIYMGHMRFEDTKPYEDNFWEKNNINLLQAYVQNIDFNSKKIHLDNNNSMDYDKLILAVGSKSNKFGWPGENLDGVSGLYSIQDLQTIEKHSPNVNRAVIVGGGLIGIELAEMFSSRKIEVTFLVRENSYWDMILPREESSMVNNIIQHHNIDLRLSTELSEIIPNDQGKVKAIKTKNGDTIECEFVGLTAGVRPNIEFLSGTGLEINKGILVHEDLSTNIPDVYAIGDCAELKNPPTNRRSIEAVWYVGRMMGETVAHSIVGNQQSYQPGVWFNSAKFFDTEYQVYGQVSGQMPEKHKSYFWQYKTLPISIRIVYDENDDSVVGFNLMGIRFRHEVCEKWIQEKYKLKDVISNIGLAFFDPELYTTYEQKIIETYNNQFDANLTFDKKSKRLKFVNRFLQKMQS